MNMQDGPNEQSFPERRIIEKKFKLKVDDQWTIEVDPDQIRESFVRNHYGDKWYRTATMYWIAVHYNGKDILTLSMFFSEGERTAPFWETYKRPSDS